MPRRTDISSILIIGAGPLSFEPFGSSLRSAKAAKACGARRFDALAASDFFQAIEIPASDATPSLVQCMKSEGGGYLRFAALNRQER